MSDLYLRRKDEQIETDAARCYLLERIEADTYTWLLRKRLQAHQDWLDEHEEEWGDDYPTLLFVCGNGSTERRIHNLVDSSYFDFEVMTATEERLETRITDVWAHEWDPEWDEGAEFRGL